jgi:membrane-associated phospholipid phosphatase
MLDTLQQIDAQLFHLINTGCSNVVFDYLMPWFRNRFFWAPLYFFIAAFLAINFPNDWLKIVLFAIITIVISDQISSTVLKPLFHRIRPCRDFEAVQYIRLLVNCGGGLSFPSSHAANHFAFAMFFISLFRNKWVIISAIFWASLVGFSQVYVGVHYPFDIFGGMLLGLLCGWVTAGWCIRYTPGLKTKD